LTAAERKEYSQTTTDEQGDPASIHTSKRGKEEKRNATILYSWKRKKGKGSLSPAVPLKPDSSNPTRSAGREGDEKVTFIQEKRRKKTALLLSISA